MEATAAAMHYALSEAAVLLEAAKDDEWGDREGLARKVAGILGRIAVAAGNALGEHAALQAQRAAARKRQREMEGDGAVVGTMALVMLRMRRDCSAEEGKDTTNLDDDERGGVELSSAHTGDVLPLRHAAPLPMAALDAMSNGTGIVFRKVAGPSPVATDALPPSSLGVVANIRGDQSHSRRRLYIGHCRNDIDLLSAPLRAGVRCYPTLPTPAAKEIATLNVRAECAFLQRALWVDAKLAVLKALEAVKRAVVDHKERLCKLHLTGHVDQHSGALPPPPPPPTAQWLCVDACNEGIVAITCRRALRLYLRYDGKQQCWLLLDAIWLMMARHVTEHQQFTGTVPVALAHGNEAAVVGHLRGVFKERGFTEGCVSALHAVAGMWMEVAERQLLVTVGQMQRSLRQQSKGGGGGGATVQLDRQPNSGYLSVRLSLPIRDLTTSTGGTGDTPSTGTWVALHTKFYCCEGSVVHQRTVGTDLSTRRALDAIDASGVLHLPNASGDGVQSAGDANPGNQAHLNGGVVVDVESMLWDDWNVALALRAEKSASLW